MALEVLVPAAAKVTSATDTTVTPITAPGAGATIAVTSSLPNGTYEVNVTAYITGTTADADFANMRLLVGAVPVSRILCNPANGSCSAKFRIDTSLGGTISVIAVSAGTAGSKYWAQIIATRIN